MLKTSLILTLAIGAMIPALIRQDVKPLDNRPLVVTGKEAKVIDIAWKHASLKQDAKKRNIESHRFFVQKYPGMYIVRIVPEVPPQPGQVDHYETENAFSADIPIDEKTFKIIER